MSTKKDCLSAALFCGPEKALKRLRTGRADLEYICECRVFKEQRNAKGVP